MSAVLLAPVIAALAVTAAAAVLAVQRSSQRRMVGRLAPAGAGRGTRILAFTGESCTVCHVAQRPALSRLRDDLPDVEVTEIDVASEPETARAYGVMTLPTTVVLDAGGRISAVNTGFATEATLRGQVAMARTGDRRASMRR
jgi:hypothetical protein